MKRLFGTDGIRGVAGEPPLDAPTVRCFGAALAEVLGPGAARAPRVLLGRDTRESGLWLRDAVAAGLTARGATAVDVGVITTPGLAHVLRPAGFDAGVMISASHNPFEDNGLKVFGRDGTKLPDAVERQIEAWILDRGMQDPGQGGGATKENGSLIDDYLGFLERLLPAGRLGGLRLALDCANGSASRIAPAVFGHYGAQLYTVGDAPDGRNINLNCGSTHLDNLVDTVRKQGCEIGLAFDGDADRCLAVDCRGRVVDGDHILFIVGRRLKRSGRLRGDGLVATIMSNFWLEERLAAEGIRIHRAPVGDKYVLEQMNARDLVLGGEQSGHIIFRDHATTGDGILSGLMFLDGLVDGAESLEAVMDGITPYPQVLVNVRVREKPDLRAHGRIGPVVRELESELAGTGRVVLRYSGTEPVARVMLEGKDEEAVRRRAQELALVIRQEIGA